MTFVPVRRSTARLELRELEEGDAEATNVWESDPVVVRYETDDVRTIDESRAYIQRSRAETAKEPRAVWDLLVRTKDGAPVGRVGLRISRPAHREATLWFVFRRDVWGRGYATEAAAAILDLAFDEAGAHRVFGDADPRNVGSWRVMEKLGMRREAHLRHAWLLKDEWCDSYLYAILEDEWRARRNEASAPPAPAKLGPIRVLAVAGSLGLRSSNAALVASLDALAPDGVEIVRFAGLGDLPLFDPDREGEAPASVHAWRDALRASDAVLVATPEYGHSLPGVLKNAIDWVIGSGELERKVVAITASVPHADRGRRGLSALRQTLGAVSATIVGGEPIARGPTADADLRALLEAVARAARR